MIFLFVAVALIVGAPLIAAILVSVASRHEDAERSLAGRPPGRLSAAVRSLLSLRIRPGQATDGTVPRGASFRSARVPRSRASGDDRADPTLALPGRNRPGS